jgi:transposase
VAALDIGKASVMACIRVPHKDQRRRRQEVCEYGTTTGALLVLAGHLRRAGVTLAAMEATSDYWKPVFYMLEAEGITCWLLNAKHVKNVPGRPRPTSWTRCGWPRSPSGACAAPPWSVPKPIRQLRDLTRYRRSLIRERTAEEQRVEKLLEDAQIKLSSVASNIFGVSGRQMLAATLAGQHDPKILAQIDQATARIEEQIAPFAAAVEQLDEITGVGVISAQELIAELGVDMSRFPTAGHLVSWAKFAPSDSSSAGKKTSARPSDCAGRG